MAINSLVNIIIERKGGFARTSGSTLDPPLDIHEPGKTWIRKDLLSIIIVCLGVSRVSQNVSSWTGFRKTILQRHETSWLLYSRGITDNGMVELIVLEKFVANVCLSVCHMIYFCRLQYM